MKSLRAVLMLSLILTLAAAAAVSMPGASAACTTSNVEVTATGGDLGPTGYVTLGAAFNAINAGTSTGAITILICSDTAEGATSATLNSSGAGSANYTSVLIKPDTDARTISGGPAQGFGVIQLNGADNVTIDGDNPNSAGINRDLTVTNNAASSTTFGSAIRIATSATSPYNTNDNITIKNLNVNGNVTAGNNSGITTSTSSTNNSFGIVAGPNGGASPTALTSVTSGIVSGVSVNSLVIDNNAVNACGRGIAFLGFTTSPFASTGISITNNTIGAAGTLSGDPPYASPATTIYEFGVLVQGTAAVTVSGNTIQNILSYTAVSKAGIEFLSGIGTGTLSITSNTITGVVLNSSAANSSYTRGMSIRSAGGAYTIRGNTVTNVQNWGGSGGVPIGIYLSNSAPSATIESNKVTTIYNRNPATFGVAGISLTGGSNITVRNNFVSDINEDISGNKFSGAAGIFGLAVNLGTGHRVYHNSVNLSGTVIGTGSILSSAFGIASTTLTGVDVRNNIFSNVLTGGSGSVSHACTFWPPSGTSAMDLTWNNNAYYSGPSVTTQGIAQVGQVFGTGFYVAADFNPGATSPAANFRSYTSTLSLAGTNDNASFAATTAAPFTSPTDLHIPNGTPTPLESNGAAVGVATDIDGDARNATTPDIGADEFAGVVVDILPPTIGYTALSNTTSTSNRSFTGVTVTDPSGVNTASGTRPRVYYKRSTDSNAYNSNDSSTNGWKYVEANGATSPFDFTIDYSKLSGGGGVSAGQNVQYFVVAQDLTAPPNVGINSGTFGAVPASVNLSAAAFPIGGTPRSYFISAGVSGSRTLCPSGCDYSSLTNSGGVFDWINQNVLSGNLLIDVQGDSTGETGAVALNQWPEDGAGGYAVTIKPSGAARVISGTGSTSLIKLSGADRVIIDGSLTALTGSDRSLTITVSGTTQSVIWIASASTTDGATGNIIENCIISGVDGTGTTIGGIIAGSGTVVGNEAEAPNSNNTVRNNRILKAQNGMYVRGKSGSPDENWLITGNTIGSAVAGEKMTFRGILFGNSRNAALTGNTIHGVITAGTSTTTGIQVAFNHDGDLMSGNTISDIKNTNGTGFGCNGILLGAATTASNVTVANNVIYDIAAFGFNGTGSADNGYGIFLSAGGGYKLYHNSVRMTTEQTSASGIPAAINISSAITTAGSLDLRDNIFGNSQSVGSARYAIYCGAANTVFANINYNDYYSETGTLGFLGAAQGTIALWRTATGKDLQSISADPLFTSTTDLSPQPGSPVVAAGQPVGITTDILGVSRSAAAPTMGAYEAVTDLQAAKTDSPDPVLTGSNITYVITVTNNGPNVAAAPRLAEATAPNTTFVSLSAPGGWSCTTPPVGGTGAINCSAASLGISASAQFTLVVKVLSCLGTLPVPVTSTTNTAIASSDVSDSSAANNTASASTQITESGACDDALFCTVGDHCGGGVCLASARDCSDAHLCTTDSCNESSDACDHTVTGAGSLCRGPAGECDAPENCDGAGIDCPPDLLRPAAYVCRSGSNDLCDPDETCTGASTQCPPNVVEPGTFACRASAGPCDVAENCPGAAGQACPPDAFKSNTEECRASQAPCDPAEFCTGAGAACPADVVSASAAVGNTVRVAYNPVTHTATISWTGETLPGPYGVYRGSISTGGWTYNQACLADQVAGTSTTDTDALLPALGHSLYYLVSRREVPCAESSLGTGSNGSPRPNACACPASSCDADRDGIPDYLDNCPTVANPDQTEAIGKGIGAACDSVVSSQSAPAGRPKNGNPAVDPAP